MPRRRRGEADEVRPSQSRSCRRRANHCSDWVLHAVKPLEPDEDGGGGRPWGRPGPPAARRGCRRRTPGGAERHRPRRSNRARRPRPGRRRRCRDDPLRGHAAAHLAAAHRAGRSRRGRDGASWSTARLDDPDGLRPGRSGTGRGRCSPVVEDRDCTPEQRRDRRDQRRHLRGPGRSSRCGAEASRKRQCSG